jgi:hypothetical protein
LEGQVAVIHSLDTTIVEGINEEAVFHGDDISDEQIEGKRSMRWDRPTETKLHEGT